MKHKVGSARPRWSGGFERQGSGKAYRANIMNKLALRNLAQLVKYAIREGIVKLEMNQAEMRSRVTRKWPMPIGRPAVA